MAQLVPVLNSDIMIFKIAYRILVLMAMTFIALAFSGCSKSGEPSHLEPIISDLEVDEVSRTSARLSAMVENRGTVVSNVSIS